MSSHIPMLSNLDKFASVRLDLLSRGGLQLGRASWHVLALKFPGESLFSKSQGINTKLSLSYSSTSE